MYRSKRGTIRYFALLVSTIVVLYLYWPYFPAPKDIVEAGFTEDPYINHNNDGVPLHFESSDPELVTLLQTFPDCEIHCTKEQWALTEIVTKEHETSPLSIPKVRLFCSVFTSQVQLKKGKNGPKWPLPRKCNKAPEDFSSQVGQDAFVIDYYNNTCGRTFVELGAANGW